MKASGAKAVSFIIFLAASFLFFGCLGGPSAEEYYSLGMAYFDLGKYEEAEKWLSRAKLTDRTMNASEYNLGRLQFETKRYGEAARNFESILKKDPQNVMALKAAAFARLKNGDYERAEAHYQTLLELVPESADDGYNYALLLYTAKKYAEAEAVLRKYPLALDEAGDALLLLARAQKEQDEPQAVDSYAQWLAANKDPKVSYEYAQLLEKLEFYAKALEQYRASMEGLPQDNADKAGEGGGPTRAGVRFTIARLLLIADGENPEGITELKAAVNDGYADFDAIEALSEDKRLSDANRTEVRSALAEAKKLEAKRKAGAEKGEAGPPDETPPAGVPAAEPPADAAPAADENGGPALPESAFEETEKKFEKE